MAEEVKDEGLTRGQIGLIGAGAGLASDLLGAYFSGQQYRNELQIRREERAISKLLADSQFNRSMRQLFESQEDMREQLTRENEQARKSFKQRQAEMRVIAAERGQEGQSVVDIHNDLSAGYENFRMLQLSNLQRLEREGQYRRSEIIDRRTAERLQRGVSDATFRPGLDIAETLVGGSIDFLKTYNKYFNFDTDFEDRSEE